MAKDKLSAEQQEIVRAQNDALLRLPANADDRLKLIHNYRVEKAKENDLIAQAKRDIGSSETLKRLTSAHGLKPQAIKFINVLSEMAPTDRSAALRQVINHGEDAGWIIPDLFDKGAVGVGSNDEAGATFDQTRTGKSQGGAKAEPRTTEQMASSHSGAAPTPGLDITSPEARAAVVKKLEDYLAANPPKRGPQPKELKELRENAKLAEEAEKAAQEAAQPPPGPSTEVPPAPPEEPSNVVTFAKQQGSANEAAEAHIREQSAKMADPAPGKPKRPRGKKADVPFEVPAAEAAGGDAPPPPPADDDDDGPDFRSAPVGANTIGDQPSSYTVR